jgi:hypothetical protein
MSLFLLGCFLTACGTTKPQVVTEYKTETLIRDRYVTVDPSLTEPVEIIKPRKPKGDADTIDLIVALQLQQNEARMCNGKLAEISGLAGTELDKDSK